MIFALAALTALAPTQDLGSWPQHSMDRPQPPVVTPAPSDRQYPPLVNPSRPPGEWQSYDIVFHAPRFDASGKVLSPARVTVLFNNVLVQDNVVLSGPTANMRRPPYRAHPDRMPLLLQDHGVPVRYRNIWIRELK